MIMLSWITKIKLRTNGIWGHVRYRSVPRNMMHILLRNNWCSYAGLGWLKDGEDNYVQVWKMNKIQLLQRELRFHIVCFCRCWLFLFYFIGAGVDQAVLVWTLWCRPRTTQAKTKDICNNNTKANCSWHGIEFFCFFFDMGKNLYE
jgi:hypothetical protein